MPLREHLKAIERRTGRPHPALTAAAKLPEGCAALWVDFMELRSCVQPGMAGPSRIDEASIYYFQRNRGFRFAAWELDAIRKADSEFMALRAEQMKGAK